MCILFKNCFAWPNRINSCSLVPSYFSLKTGKINICSKATDQKNINHEFINITVSINITNLILSFPSDFGNFVLARLRMESVGFGALMIKGLDSNKYICMKETKGNIYVSVSCNYLFINHYTTLTLDV